MRKGKKAKPGDPEVLADPLADPVERQWAMNRLMVDRRYECEADIVALLEHENTDLRDAALSRLIHYWRRTEHLPRALHLLEHAPTSESRSAAASALRWYLGAPGRFSVLVSVRKTLLRALLAQLRREPDPFSKASMYAGLIGVAVGSRDKLDELSDPKRIEDNSEIDWAFFDAQFPELNGGEPLPPPKFAGPNDVSLLTDESATLHDRQEAIGNLVRDDAYDHEPTLRGLVHHSSGELRAHALLWLISEWGRADLVPLANERMKSESNPEVRAKAAYSLFEFLAHHGDEIAIERRLELQIALARRLREESDPSARADVYTGFLELGGDDGTLVERMPDATEIHSDDDIDWGWLREHFPEAFGS